MLGATWVQFVARDPLNSGHQSSIRPPEPFFRRFCNEDLFFSFGLHIRIRIIRDENFSLFFLLVFTPKFEGFRAYFAMKTFFYDLHSRIRGKKVFEPAPKHCLCPPPSQVTPLWRRV